MEVNFLSIIIINSKEDTLHNGSNVAIHGNELNGIYVISGIIQHIKTKH